MLKTMFVKKIDPRVAREKASEKLDLSIEKWKRAIKNHRISSLEARIAVAKLNISYCDATPSSRALAVVDKAEAEMLLAKIEMEDAKDELSQYPSPLSDYGQMKK